MSDSDLFRLLERKVALLLLQGIVEDMHQIRLDLASSVPGKVGELPDRIDLWCDSLIPVFRALGQSETEYEEAPGPTTCPHCKERHSINLQALCGSMHGAVKVELEIGPAYGEVTLCVKGPKGWLTLIAEDDVGLTDLGCMEGHLIPADPLGSRAMVDEELRETVDFVRRRIAAGVRVTEQENGSLHVQGPQVIDFKIPSTCIPALRAALSSGSPEPSNIDGCPGCGEGLAPVLLDEDGTLVSVSGKPGRWGHAQDDYWWFCAWYMGGYTPASAESDAPVPSGWCREWQVTHPEESVGERFDDRAEAEARCDELNEGLDAEDLVEWTVEPILVRADSPESEHEQRHSCEGYAECATCGMSFWASSPASTGGEREEPERAVFYEVGYRDGYFAGQAGRPADPSVPDSAETVKAYEVEDERGTMFWALIVDGPGSYTVLPRTGDEPPDA